LHSFHHAFTLTETGLHRPKIVICLGTSGGSFKQLVKGEDDIRQDCIMVRAPICLFFLVCRKTLISSIYLFFSSQQQVFSTVNRIFKVAAGKRLSAELQIATYTVVPLSPASGVLEWVVSI
jgi:ataxia telangiectasia mutated family protein